MRYQMIPSPTDRCAILLDQAWYCESCHSISNDATCCSCASAEHNRRLALWLDREREPIRVPQTGVYLTVIPPSRKLSAKTNSTPPLKRAPCASRGTGTDNRRSAGVLAMRRILRRSRGQDIHHPKGSQLKHPR